MYLKRGIAFVLLMSMMMGKGISQQARLILPTASTNKLQDVRVSADEKYTATVDLDGVIKFWETATGRLFQTFLHPNGTYIAISHDNRYIISGGLDHTLKIWDVENGVLFKSLAEDIGPVSALEMSKDGKLLVTGNQDGTIFLWDTQTWKLIHKSETGDMVNAIKFSSDGKWFATACEKDIYTWDLQKTTPLLVLKGHTSKVHSLAISADDKWLLSGSWDNTAQLWNLATGKSQMIFSGHTESVFDAEFSPDQKSIVTASNDNTIRIWDIQTGKTIKTLTGHTGWVTKLRFSPDGKNLISISFDKTARIWEYPSGKLLYTLEGHKDDIYYISVLAKSNKVLIGSYDNDVSSWNIASGKMDFYFGLHNEPVTSIAVSHDTKKVLTTYRDGRVKIIDVATGAVIRNINAHDNWATSGLFSPDDQRVISAGTDNRLKVWDANNGKLLAQAPANASIIDACIKYSPGDKFLLSWGNQTFSIYDMETGQSLGRLKGSSSYDMDEFSNSSKYFLTGEKNEIQIWQTDNDSLVVVKRITLEADHEGKVLFSPDETKIITVDSVLTTYDIASGKLFNKIKTSSGSAFVNAWLLKDSKTLLACDKDYRLYFVDAATMTITRTIQLDGSLFTENGHGITNEVTISPNGQFIATNYFGEGMMVWRLDNGKLIGMYPGDHIVYTSGETSCIVTNNGELNFYSLPTGKKLFRHFVTGENDWLVEDSLGRFDGTEAARKQLYFTCGTELIELDRVKDQLWVPGLAGRINQKDTINAKTIDELNLCGLTPSVEKTGTVEGEYRFKIIPHRGGIGETAVFVNGIEVKRYKLTELTKTADGFELLIKKEELENNFIAGQENPVTIKVFTADNTISSRGLVIKEDKTKQSALAPNLYAVMVGVSDYKGDELDLKYAAKDATDISNAVSSAARKLLNGDGKEHVFMYKMTTAADHYQLPEKNSIRKILEEIGKKANANDILLIFFAGHGVMDAGGTDKKQFYFLTADASRTTATEAASEVGISTTELIDWIKPSTIKAQKRILIFDACNSGQAINDFVKMGNSDQGYVVARNDDLSQEVKAIDKLNEKSGLFILSASASNQSAYEMGRYAQGLLTYSLLKAIKQQPDILTEGKYLDLSRWFNAAKETVSELSKESGARQEPQVVSNTNFNIGIVDNEVMAKIVLPQERPLFAASNFQNSDEKADGDNLDLSKLINLQLYAISSRGTDNSIVYITATNSPDAYTLSGRYDVKDDDVTVRVGIKKNNEIKYRFEEKGTASKLADLVNRITTKAADWAAANK